VIFSFFCVISFVILIFFFFFNYPCDFFLIFSFEGRCTRFFWVLYPLPKSTF